MSITLATLEAIVDRAQITARVEALMPTGGRPRQLSVRTLLVGILAAIADGRPAHLRRVHGALIGLAPGDQRRLGVIAPGRRREQTLTYRQVERTFSTMMRVLAGVPEMLDRLSDALAEASIPALYKDGSQSLAADWTDHASWSRPVEAGSQASAADADAAWGHRKPNRPGACHEAFFGYYAQTLTMVGEEAGPQVPELVRRVALWPCDVDPPTALVGVFERMARDGIALGDTLADSGYAHRLAEHWATPLRRLGARLVCDLHPHDRGPRGTHQGAIVCNGNLYCPATPATLLALGPLAPDASQSETFAHDIRSAELARYKLGRISSDDADGYHRVACPAAAGKLRCALKAASLTLGLDRPEVLAPPSPSLPCCVQSSITVAPTINAKTRQKHDYPSRAHRLSYARRTGAERSFATLKDPASTDVRRGWCRLMGRAKNLVMLVCAVVIRNLRVLASFERHMAEVARGAPPRRRRRRRRLAD